jgi:hypothetical protein
MIPVASVAQTVNYGRKLVSAAGSGIRSGERAVLNDKLISTLLVESARDSIKFSAATACVGLLYCYLTNRCRPFRKTIAYGALGFCVAIVWKTRKTTASIAQSAIKEMQKVSDEHWLEMNPVDFG